MCKTDFVQHPREHKWVHSLVIPRGGTELAHTTLYLLKCELRYSHRLVAIL